MKIKGLYQKRGWWYWNRMVRGHRVYVALETQDQAEAIQRALKLKQRPQIIAGGRLENEVKRFIAQKLAHKEFSRFSAQNKTLTLLRFCREMGDVLPASITEANIRAWYKKECDRVVGSTAQGYLMAVRSFFNWMVQENLLAKNPTHAIRIEKWDYGHRVKFCEPELRDKLLKKTKDPILAFVVHAGFEAGMRRNEIIEARPSWFDLKSRTVFVKETDTFTPKDREARAIPMTDVLFNFLKKHPMKGKYCIAPDVERGKSRYRYDFIRAFTTYMADQKVPWVTPHVMRHTFGSLLASGGESLLKIARWMGDDPRVVERHYAHLQPGDRSINRLHGDHLSDSPSPTKPQSAKPRSPRRSRASKKPPRLPGRKA